MDARAPDPCTGGSGENGEILPTKHTKTHERFRFISCVSWAICLGLNHPRLSVLSAGNCLGFISRTFAVNLPWFIESRLARGGPGHNLGTFMAAESRRRSALVWSLAGAAAVALVALLPWWRNHAYLRDFYDYGVVIAGLARLDEGARPYVDFVTPIQAGFFGLSWLVQRAGDGSYLALTRGGGALILLMGAGLALLLGRRWPAWAALPVAASITVASASQHTILWHNALGVFALALAVWTAAIAPVLRRATWPWHVWMLAGLYLGGLNKLNFQLVALAVVLAWALRAWLIGRASPREFSVTVLVAMLAGVVLPLATELVWTGASLDQWRHNVIALAGDTRASDLQHIFSWKFLWTPIHDYYGRLLLPQVGLVGLILSVGAWVAGWTQPSAARADRWLQPVAAAIGALAGAAFLATNQEIAYLGLAGWLVLVVSLWLGFERTVRPRVAGPVLLLPALVLGVAAWVAAWQGQRSQFGYSESLRSAYQQVDANETDLRYVGGLWLPPEQVLTLRELRKWVPAPGPDGLRPVFYGPGTEWLERLWPAIKVPGQPLWVHWDTTYRHREIYRLLNDVGTADRYRMVLVTLARDFWPPALRRTLEQFYDRTLIGPVTVRWTRRDGWQLQCKDGVEFVNRYGGNVAGTAFFVHEQPLADLAWESDHFMLGVTRGEGRLLLVAPTHRFGGDAVIERLPPGEPRALRVRFKVIVHGATPEEVRWDREIELAPNENRKAVPFTVDAMGQRLELQVSVIGPAADRVAAGYRNFAITHSIESADGAPVMRAAAAQAAVGDEAMAQALLGDIAWRPQQLITRAGQATSDGIVLPAGGEIWWHSENMLGEVRGQVRSTSSDPSAVPLVRVVWCKGGRLQLLQQGFVSSDGTFNFHGWCAEPGGWIGVLLDPGSPAVRASVRLQSSTLAP